MLITLFTALAHVCTYVRGAFGLEKLNNHNNQNNLTMRKFTLFFAALLVALGVSAQTASDYYTFEAEVLLDASKRLTSQDSLTAGKHIVIQHCHEGTAHEGHEGAYISFYSLDTNGKHKVYMQENPVGLVIFTTQAGAVANRFKLQTSHMRCKEKAHACYLQEPDQTGELSAGSTSFDFQFKYVSDGKWQIVVPDYSETSGDGYLWVDTETGKNPAIGTFTIAYGKDTKKEQAQSYFYVYEVNPATDTRGVIKYVTNATVRLTGPSGNQITTTHTGWSDFYEFTMYSWERYNGTNYGVSISNVLYHSDANLITADISYPFAISGEVAKIPVHLCPNGNTTRIAVVDGTLKTLNKSTASAELWTKNKGNQWYIYPKYVVGATIGENDFYYAIQNVATKQYLRYSSETGSISLHEASDDATVATLPDDCFFKLNGNSDGSQIYFTFMKGSSIYYLYGNEDGVGSTYWVTTGAKFTVPNVVATELDGEAAIGFTRYFHEDTYFWDGGVMSTADVPDAVNAILEMAGHEDRDAGTHNVYGAKTGITVTQVGQVNVTFNYTSGANALQILGVDIVSANGNIISRDYHPGKAGDPSKNNQYVLTNVAAGDYYLRYWVCSYEKSAYEGHDLAKVRGSIDVVGANYRWEPATTLNEANATWYRMRLSDGLERYISAQVGYVDGQKKLLLSNNTPPTDYAGLWTMVGDNTNGYKFYNRAAGAEYALKTEGEGESARTYLTSVADASTYDVVQQDGNYQFFVKLHGTDNYLYKQGIYLATSANALGDPNAVMTFETVYSTGWETDLNVKPLEGDVDGAILASGLYTMGVDENKKRGYVGASAEWPDYPVLCDISWDSYKTNSATAMENGKTWFVLAIDQDSYVFYNVGNGKYLVNSTAGSDGVVNFGDTPYIWNLSMSGNYMLISDPWHNTTDKAIYLSGGCGRIPANRPMAWDRNPGDGGAKYTLADVENTAWNLEALKSQIMNALAQELPLTLSYDKGTLSTTCKAINQVDKVQVLQETFELTGYTGATLGDISFTQNGELSATLTFPETLKVQTPVMFGAFNNENNLWFAHDNGVRMVQNSLPTQSTDGNYQWKLIPVLNGKELTVTIQNVGTGKYVFANATVSNHDKGAVTLEDAGTLFVPNDAGQEFQVKGKTLYLSLDKSGTKEQWIGIHTNTHGGTTHKLIVVELATADEVAEAKAVIGTGLGYPKTTTTEYADLNALTEANSKKAVTGTLNAYYACTDVELPENGKAYKISAWWRTRTWPLTFVAETSVSGLYASAYVPTENAAAENVAVFVCRKLDDGTYAFVTDNGNYLGWQTDNSSSNATSTTYSDGTHWKVQKAVTGSDTGDLKQTELLGKLLLYANVDPGAGKDWYAYMFSYNTKHFHNGQASQLYYGDNAHTVYYTFEEVSANTLIEVGLATIQETDKLLIGSDLTNKTIGTFSAPYATVIPDGVTAYYAAKAEEAGQFILKPVDGKALPAEQGVVLVGEEGVTSAMMLPVAGETTATMGENMFEHSANGPVTMGANDYILSKTADYGIGLYKASQNSTLKQGKAYLTSTGSGANSFVLNFSGVTTDIEGAPTVAPSQQVIYDLSGRRVNAVTKGGIYIVNGKKMIIK